MRTKKNYMLAEQCYHLRVVDGLSTKEIADRLGLSKEEVRHAGATMRIALMDGWTEHEMEKEWRRRTIKRGIRKGARRHEWLNNRPPFGEVPPGPGPGPAADKNDITVYVLTNGNDPIEEAVIYIYEESVLVKSGITDEDGLYETTLDDGTYKFVAKADGYREEHQTKTITADTTVVFRLTTVGVCPAIFAGPYLGISVLGWIVAAILVFIGFLIAYLIDSKHLSKDYLVLILFPNVVLVILGLFCQPLLILIGVACAIIQWLWAKEERL